MKTVRIPTLLLALASIASVGTLHAQQTTNQGANQRDAAATTKRDDALENQNRQQHSSVPLKQAILQKLQKSNEAEIELAKVAISRSENQQVQQFAKMLVEDHQACVQKLREMRGQQATGNRIGNDQQKTKDSTDNNPAATNVPRNDVATNRVPSADNTAGHNLVPGQLIQIMDQACEHSLKMTKEMLEKYEGQDFAMAFLGQQCVAHTMMIGELKAIQSHGPEELKSMAEEAASKAQMHLDKAKELAKQLEDDRDTTRAARANKQ